METKNKIITLEPIEDKPVKSQKERNSEIINEVEFRLGEFVSSLVFTETHIIVLGTPDSDEALDSEVIPEEDWHNCDAMGCGQCHVLRRIEYIQKPNLS